MKKMLTKCTGDKCPLKNDCKRTKSIMVRDVDYFAKPPFKIIKGLFTCPFFTGDPARMLLVQLQKLISRSPINRKES